MPSGDETLPLGDPPIREHQAQSGLTELAQRLIAFPFTPPDVNLKQNDGLSTSNDWFTKHDKNKIDELGMIGFYASSGPQSVGVVPKTSYRFLERQNELQKPEVTQWYQNDILSAAADFNTVKANVDQAVNILTSRKDKIYFWTPA